MTVTIKPIIYPKYAEPSQAVEYTSTNGVTVVDVFTATNASLSVCNISVYIVKESEPADNSNIIIKERSINIGETWVAIGMIGQVIPKGSRIIVVSNAASSITISAGGREVT